MNQLIKYEGRKVTKQWYRRYVLNQPATRMRRASREILAWVLLPATGMYGDKEEIRLIDLSRWQQVRWLEDLQADYAAMDAGMLPTFFHKHK